MKRCDFYWLKYKKRVGKFVISACKKAQEGLQMHYIPVKKSSKRSGVGI